MPVLIVPRVRMSSMSIGVHTHHWILLKIPTASKHDQRLLVRRLDFTFVDADPSYQNRKIGRVR